MSLTYRALFRSLLYSSRYGRWQQIPSRLLCKVPPIDPTEVQKEVQSNVDEKKNAELKEAEDIKQGQQEQKTELSKELQGQQEQKIELSTEGANIQSKESQEKQEKKTELSKEPQEQKVELSTEGSNEQPKEPEKTLASETSTKQVAETKLNDLLSSIIKEDPKPNNFPRVELSKPKARSKAAQKKRKATAAKSGSKAAGHKLHVQTLFPPVEEDVASPSAPEEVHLEPRLVAATKNVAESLGGDVETTESELLSTLRSHTSDDAKLKSTFNLSELFLGMNIERTNTQKKFAFENIETRSWNENRSIKEEGSVSEDFEQELPMVLNPRGGRAQQYSVELFRHKKFNIFDMEALNAEPTIGESILPVWDMVQQRELELSRNLPPSNSFLEMINWTKQGKLWTFPIDNEFGLEEEKKIGFHEHVFLEHHLDDWCPKRGPIRHFMELVCIGLSKNPYLTVERKKNHIQWYRDYFEAKIDVLKDIGAIETK